MKKLYSIFAGAALFMPLMAGAVAPDQCDQQFVKEGGGSYSDSRMAVNIHNGDAQIDVSGQTGYEVLEVFLSVENDGHTGYWQYASGPITNFNPPGDDITAWKVRVKKACVVVVPPSPVPPPATTTPPVATTTPPVATTTPPVAPSPASPVTGSSSGGNSPTPGGRRHCIDTSTGRYCPPGITDTQIVVGVPDESPTLLGLRVQLLNLLQQLLARLQAEMKHGAN